MNHNDTPIIMQRNRASIGLYFCGGTGMDTAAVTQQMHRALSSDELNALAQLNYYGIDSSISNLSAAHSGMPFFHLKKDGKPMDGGGKIMNEVFNVAMKAAPDIVREMPCSDNNVVIMNMGGGTGPGTGLAIVQEILKAGKNVIILGVYPIADKFSMENTSRTTALLKSLVNKHQRSVIVGPYVSEGAETFIEVNSLIAHSVMMLAALLSNQNNRLDSADLNNWINFENITKDEPGLMGLYYSTGTTALPDSVQPLTLATLTSTDSEGAQAGWDASHQVHGILPSKCPNIFSTTPAHFIVADGVVQEVYNTIRDREQAMARTLANRPKIKPLDLGDVDLGGMSL